MQAYKDEATDLNQRAYFCHGCEKAYLGRPQTVVMEDGAFDEDGEWVENGRFAPFETCHDEPPCKPGQSGRDPDNMFQVGTLKDLVVVQGIGYYYTQDNPGEAIRISRHPVWKCGNCECGYDVDDYGAARAEKRAVSCCQ